MTLTEAVQYVSQRFVYKTDKYLLLDHWSVMPDEDGNMYGDCDDFSTTVLWLLCDRSLLKFIWNVFILHRYKLWRVYDSKGNLHVVGSVGDMFFDNWTLAAMPKQQFLAVTKHTLKFAYPSFMFLFPMLLGYLVRGSKGAIM